jgi:GNAT superfamily N-acetyltransferase
MKLVFPYSITAEDIAAWHKTATAEPKNIFTALVAVDEADLPVGSCHPGHYDGMPEGLFDGGVSVYPDHRARGVGRMLWAAVEQFAREHGATGLQASCKGDDEASFAWAQRRGFVLDRVRTEAVLDLTAWNGSRFAGQVERVQAAGIRLLAIAKSEAEPYLRGMYDVETATWPDIPIWQGTVQSRESWEREWRNSVEPMMIALALDGDTVVGSSILGLPRERGGQAGTHFTGVLKAYRGRGVALALKLLTIEAALAAGAVIMRTNNDPDNPPMLRVNEKLGYTMVPGPKRLKKIL